MGGVYQGVESENWGSKNVKSGNYGVKTETQKVS